MSSPCIFPKEPTRDRMVREILIGMWRGKRTDELKLGLSLSVPDGLSEDALIHKWFAGRHHYSSDTYLTDCVVEWCQVLHNLGAPVPTVDLWFDTLKNELNEVRREEAERLRVGDQDEPLDVINDEEVDWRRLDKKVDHMVDMGQLRDCPNPPTRGMPE